MKKHQRAIIVLHDGKDSAEKMQKELDKNADSKYNRSWVPEIADSLISTLLKNGYQFDTLK
jgi:hypothetical protein